MNQDLLIKLDELKRMCEGQNYRTFPSNDICIFAKKNNFLIFYGASDDLLEVEGVLQEEFDLSNSNVSFVDFSNYNDKAQSIWQEKLLQFMSKAKITQKFNPIDNITWEISCKTCSNFANTNFTLIDDTDFNIGLIIHYAENVSK